MKQFLTTFRILPLLLFIIPVSCRTYLNEPYLADIETPPAPEKLLESFRKTWPESMTIEQSAVIRMGSREITSLGLCYFNRQTNELSLALMTTTGMKIMEVNRKNGKTETKFALAEFAKNKKAPMQLIQDVANIYFMPEGEPESYEIRKNMITYKWHSPSSTNTPDADKSTELIFGREKTTSKLQLKIKKLYKGTKITAIVYYYSFREKNGKSVPISTGYENREYNYTLKLNTKRIF